MTRAARELWLWLRGWGRYRPHRMPRPSYCDCCDIWSWSTRETPAYSSYDWALLCEDCAVENDHETDLAWQDYWSGRL